MFKRWLSNASSKKKDIFTAVLLAVAVTASLVIAESKRDSAPPVSASVRLEHIKNTQAVSALRTLQLGLSTRTLPKSPQTLVLSSNDSTKLEKARLVIDVMDSKQIYTINSTPKSDNFKTMPPVKTLSTNLPDFVIGTYDEPPATATENPKVLVVEGKTNIFTIAPVDSIKQVSKSVNDAINGVPQTQDNPFDRSTASNMSKPGEKPTETKSTEQTAKEAEDRMAAVLEAISKMGAAGKKEQPKESTTKKEAPTQVEPVKPVETEKPSEEIKETPKTDTAKAEPIENNETKAVIETPVKEEVDDPRLKSSQHPNSKISEDEYLEACNLELPQKVEDHQTDRTGGQAAGTKLHIRRKRGDGRCNAEGSQR